MSLTLDYLRAIFKGVISFQKEKWWLMLFRVNAVVWFALLVFLTACQFGKPEKKFPALLCLKIISNNYYSNGSDIDNNSNDKCVA